MKNRIITVILLLLLMTLFSCKKIDIFLLDRDNTMIVQCATNIFNYINMADKESITQMFSKKAITSVNDFDSDVDRLLQCFDGTIISWVQIDSPVIEESVENGRKTKGIITWFKALTENSTYYVFFAYIPINEIDTDNKGIYAMMIVDETCQEKLTGTMEEWAKVPGITIKFTR